MQESSNQTPLSSVWELHFQDPTSNETKDYKKADFIGEIKTVEEAISTFNSLPPINTQKARSAMNFCRKGHGFTYEDYPGGNRIIVDSFDQNSTSALLLLMMSEVMSDNIVEKVKGLDGKNPCHLIRLSYKPRKGCFDAARLEIWTDDCDCIDEVVAYFSEILKKTRHTVSVAKMNATE